MTFWLLAQLPGTVLGLLVASFRFGFALRVGWTIVSAIAFVALAGSCVGYALAMLMRPQLASQAGSFLSIGILLFSPINFPIERLPWFLEVVHRALPVKYMADLVRWSLTEGQTGNARLAFAVVSAWCAAGLVTSWRIVQRRA